MTVSNVTQKSYIGESLSLRLDRETSVNRQMDIVDAFLGPVVSPQSGPPSLYERLDREPSVSRQMDIADAYHLNFLA